MQTIARKCLSDTVVDRIRDHILTNKLRTGDRLPTEHEFADRLGVSRLAVREATKSLEFLGLLEASPRRGLTVGELDLKRVTPFLRFHPAVREATAAQLIDTRIVVETGGLPFAAERMRNDPAIYEGLASVVARSHKASTLSSWIELDLEFHRLLLAASGLAPLVAFNDLLQIFFLRFRESVKKAEWKQGIKSHQSIVDALRDGRPQQARDELVRHIESHRHRQPVGRKS
ncbi:MAG: FadR family transcriptional regulator [Planctomycetia bacterium]|nr:FadR family transcriptional regulator [Planctomycetia bacterium]